MRELLSLQSEVWRRIMHDTLTIPCDRTMRARFARGAMRAHPDRTPEHAERSQEYKMRTALLSLQSEVWGRIMHDILAFPCDGNSARVLR
jgi:hypothetical protein